MCQFINFNDRLRVPSYLLIKFLPAIQLLPTMQLPPAIPPSCLPSSSCLLSSACPLSLCRGFSFSSRLIVLVEVARDDGEDEEEEGSSEVCSSGKVSSSGR